MLLPEETIDIEVKVKTMKGIHTFRRDHTTQIISCKPWSPRLHPYPSLVQKMQTYLELKDLDASQPHSSSNKAVKLTISSLQKAPVPIKATDKKQKKRRKMPIRKQFKVRLIEKPLSPTMKTRSYCHYCNCHADLNDEANSHIHKVAFCQTYPNTINNI